ncbi:MAG: hypothetical protein ACOYM2_05520 [Rectinemataceae bacterium]
MKVDFCVNCRRLVLADFSYCPYCGADLGRPTDLATLLADPFSRLEKKAERTVVDERIHDLESLLADMEVELETMLAGRHEG